MIKVLVVDDHALMRALIKTLLQDVPTIRVIGEAGTGEEAIVLAKKLLPDVVILDIDMPGIGGLGAVSKLLSHNPAIKILVLTRHDTEPYPSRLLEAGVHGYITKGCNIEELIKAIQTVYNSQTYLSSDIAQKMAAKRFSNEPDSPFDLLSKREFQVVLLLIQRIPSKSIAERLFLSIKTVSGYRSHIYEKLNVHSDVELILLAMQHGLIENKKIDGV
ncbi:MAG TPA: response regulator [Gammaproteobacteria bacterium]|jgi:DNA-binding NarL/FixJ family response regulator|nr:response regulator [Gammaproteobacteria bacterium]